VDIEELDTTLTSRLRQGRDTTLTTGLRQGRDTAQATARIGFIAASADADRQLTVRIRYPLAMAAATGTPAI